MMDSLIAKAKDIAETYDISTEPDGAVVYSVSFMPTDKNKKEAKAFVASNAHTKMLDDTPCGKALIALNLHGKVDEVPEEITLVWRTASLRYIASASGNIHAFVDGADERSTFCTTELEAILKNPKITHINGAEKSLFSKTFSPKHY